MKKILVTTLMGLMLNVGSVQFLNADCREIRNSCLEECNKNYTGDTFWDGAARFACRNGCEMAESMCNVKEFLEELT